MVLLVLPRIPHVVVFSWLHSHVWVTSRVGCEVAGLSSHGFLTAGWSQSSMRAKAESGKSLEALVWNSHCVTSAMFHRSKQSRRTDQIQGEEK